MTFHLTDYKLLAKYYKYNILYTTINKNCDEQRRQQKKPNRDKQKYHQLFFFIKSIVLIINHSLN